jgi:hypothetical protein
MQALTVINKDKGYTYGDGIGLGWLVFENGLLHHSGGGPGVAAALYVHPGRGFAASILTNAEHGRKVINEVMTPWLEELGAKPFGFASFCSSSTSPVFDPTAYAGTYEDVMRRFVVSHTSTGLALTKQAKFACYESISTEPTPPTPLTPLARDMFLLESPGDDDHHDAFRLFAFRNPDSRGRMTHLGNSLRLYRRV